MNIETEDSYAYTSDNEIVNEQTKEEGEWETLKENENYEIFNKFPFSIRRKGTDKLITESIHKRIKYYCCYLDGKMYLKHRLIALQFILNPNPSKFKYVDHYDHNRLNNHLANLRWVSNLQNTNNRKDQQFLQTIDKTVASEVKTFNSWQFQDLYFINDSFVRYNGINYSVLNKWYNKQYDYYQTSITDITGKCRTIRVPKFKREYTLI